MSEWRTNTNEEYHSGEGVGSSTLVTLTTKTPAHLLVKREATPAMRLGTLIHAYVLESHLSTFIIAPEMDKRTKKYEEWKKEQPEHATIITQEEHTTLWGVYESIAKHRVANNVLTGGVAEVSGYSQCNETGVLRRIRPDYRKPGTIFDLKTTADCSPEAFQKNLLKGFTYAIQAAYYKDVADEIDDADYDFVWVVVETKPPYSLMTYRASPAVLAEGRRLYKDALLLYKTCKELNQYPSYSQATITLDIPKWYQRS